MARGLCVRHLIFVVVEKSVEARVRYFRKGFTQIDGIAKAETSARGSELAESTCPYKMGEVFM